jgi:uncharacterized hydrophobic protein (TIGR00271 family)
MLYVRLVSPATLTGQLSDRLTAIPGVHNVVIQAGLARRPDGDAVQFDVGDETANPVFAVLRDMGLDRVGGICVERVDAALTDRALHDGKHGMLRRQAVPVWEMVDAAIHGQQAYTPTFYILLAIAGLIGAVGLITNSQVLIVAAMVVGPEYSAIIGVASGISQRDSRAAKDGLFVLLWGFLATIAVTLLFGLAVRGSGNTPSAFLAGVRPVADFINKPDEFSVIVAVLAGIVGVVSLTEARANALIGVFISVTTIPAAASVGVSIAYSSWSDAGGAALQLLLNVLLLIAVGAAGLSTQRKIWHWRSARPSRQLHPGSPPVLDTGLSDEVESWEDDRMEWHGECGTRIPYRGDSRGRRRRGSGRGRP